MKTLGQKLEELRKERHWSQAVVAEKLGLERRTASISRWESDRFRPSLATLQKLAEIFEVRVEDLLGDDELPEALSKNKTLVEKMRQLEELDAEEQAVIFHIIDTYSAQKRLTTLVTVPKPRLAQVQSNSRAAS